MKVRRRYDLLVVGQRDHTVDHIAGTNLTFEGAERARRIYQPVVELGPVRVELVRAGSYSIGDTYDPPPDEEEE